MKHLKSYMLFEENRDALSQMESDIRSLAREVYELSIEHIDNGGYLGYAITVESPHEGMLQHEDKPRQSIASGMLSSQDRPEDIQFEYDSAEWVEQSLKEGMRPGAWFYLLTENTNSRFTQEINFDHGLTEELKERALDELKESWPGIKVWIG